MALSKLTIWITSQGKPCQISETDEHDKLPWVVGIWNCDGDLLTWCGKQYYNMEAKCGHLEVALPPGKYIVRAADNMILKPGGIWGNHWTDHGVVTVCCGEAACVTLYAPTVHSCGWGFLGALDRLVKARLIPANIGNAALEAIRKVMEKIPATNFEATARPMMEALRRVKGK